MKPNMDDLLLPLIVEDAVGIHPTAHKEDSPKDIKAHITLHSNIKEHAQQTYCTARVNQAMRHTRLDKTSDGLHDMHAHTRINCDILCSRHMAEAGHSDHAGKVTVVACCAVIQKKASGLLLCSVLPTCHDAMMLTMT